MKINTNGILRNQDDGGGGGGGQGGQGDAGATPVIPENWKAALPAELRDDPTMADVKDVPTLAKRHVDAQKFIGKQRVALPEKNWTDAQYSEFYQKLGRPEAPDKYTTSKIKIPQGLELDQAGLSEVQKTAHRIGLTDGQFQSMVEWYLGYEAAKLGEAKSSRETAATQAQARLREQWGDKYDTRVDLAKAALRKFGNDEFYAFLDSSNLGNQPELINVFGKIGEALMEDSAAGHGSVLQVQDSTAAKSEIKRLLTDEKFMTALTTREHAGHQAAVDMWVELHRRSAGTGVVQPS